MERPSLFQIIEDVGSDKEQLTCDNLNSRLLLHFQPWTLLHAWPGIENRERPFGISAHSRQWNLCGEIFWYKINLWYAVDDCTLGFQVCWSDVPLFNLILLQHQPEIQVAFFFLQYLGSLFWGRWGPYRVLIIILYDKCLTFSPDRGDMEIIGYSSIISKLRENFRFQIFCDYSHSCVLSQIYSISLFSVQWVYNLHNSWRLWIFGQPGASAPKVNFREILFLKTKLYFRWKGPLSIAVYAPGTDFQRAIDSILYYRFHRWLACLKSLLAYCAVIVIVFVDGMMT